MTQSTEVSFVLNNGIQMPSLGLGVLFAQNNGKVEQAVSQAIHHGYRKIDTASGYGNEDGVGRGIIDSGIDRSEVFLTTKVWNTEQGYDETLRSIDQSLQHLQTDYVDLYLVHWPVEHKYKDTYRALETIYAEGRAKAIGVCNFSIAQLETLMDYAQVTPALNQVEMHPHLSQSALLEFANLHNIQLEAWRPIMMGEVLQIPALVEIAEQHSKSAVQVALRWLIQRGVSAIPKSVTPHRIAENIDIYDFELTPDQMATIDALNQNKRLGEDLSHIY